MQQLSVSGGTFYSKKYNPACGRCRQSCRICRRCTFFKGIQETHRVDPYRVQKHELLDAP